MEKRCSKCGEVKPIMEFYWNRTGRAPDGHRPDCKRCEYKPPATQAEKFWRYVDRRGEDECWPWLRGKNNKGYGRFWLGEGKNVLASRYAWEVTYGLIPDGLEVCHRCDNPLCVNPQHLYIATHLVNMQDAGERGRMHSLRGSENPKAKMSDAAVMEIRGAYARGGITMLALAKDYGVGWTTIQKIIRRLTWRHVL